MNQESKDGILVDRVALCFSNYLKADSEETDRLVVFPRCHAIHVSSLILSVRLFGCFSSCSRFEELMGAVSILEASLNETNTQHQHEQVEQEQEEQEEEEGS